MSIRNEDDGHCGGTLVASKYVITAAHCVWNRNSNTWWKPSQLLLTIGEHWLESDLEPYESLVSVSSIIPHESYDKDPVRPNNDIAVLELAKEVDIEKYTPACLAKSTDSDYAGELAKVYGWGATVEGSKEGHHTLQEVDVPVVSNAKCSQAMSHHITPGKLCAGGQLGKDACQGDSGGPLTYKTSSGQHVLIGDVSYGVGCGRVSNQFLSVMSCFLYCLF